jgi:hypothetical protein
MSQLLLVIGGICLVIALAFGLAGQTVRVSSSRPSSGETVVGDAAGPAAQGAAGGFAVAGGLCFLGAASAARYSSADVVQVQRARLEEQEERIRQLERQLEARVGNWTEEQEQG